jgi:hypothetical protein
MLKFTTCADTYQFINIQLITCTNIQIILDKHIRKYSWVIQSLKMDQYPFRPWDDEFSSNKMLVYHIYYNILNIAVVDTLL